MKSRKIIFTDPSLKQQALLRELKKNGSAQPCSRCGGVKYGVMDGYFAHLLRKNPSIRVMGPDHLTSVVLICNGCGLVIQHNLPDMNHFVDEPERN